MSLRPFIIDTADKRCEHLYHSFLKMGFRAQRLADSKNINEMCISVFAPSKVIGKDEVAHLYKGSAVFGGKADIDAKRIMSEHGISYFNMLSDEQFVVANTIPTALGCIYTAMENSDTCINDMNTLVIGFGRVAKTLVKYLKGIEVPVSVYTADKKERALSTVFADKSINSLADLSAYDMIINTVPARLMDKQSLDTVNATALVIDFASGDFVDIKRLKENGVCAIKAMALPGKLMPKSAGEYMKKCILDTLNSNSGLKSIFLVQ